VWVDRKRIDEGNKKKINLEQLGRGLPRFDTIFARKINIILGYANETVLSKSLMTEGDPIVLAKDQKDSTLLEKNSLFLTYAQIEALEF
jgi:hypothetical protein